MSPTEATPTPTATAAATPEPTATGLPTAAPTTSATTSPTEVATPAPTVTVTATATVTAEPEPVASPQPTVTVTAIEVWRTPPAATSSGLPWGLVLSAALVLLAAVAALVWLTRRQRTRTRTPQVPVPAAAGTGLPAPGEPAGARPAVGPGAAATAARPTAGPGEPGASEAGDLMTFLVRLGGAMLDATAPSGQVNSDLLDIARVNGAPDAQVVSLPTALLVSLPGTQGTQTAAASAGARTLRLDQVQAVLEVAQDAQSGRLSAGAGVRRLDEAAASPPPYPFGLRLLGYVAVSAGLALILGGGWLDLVVAMALGAVVALVLRLTARVAAGYVALVVLGSAFLVSSATFLLARTGLDLIPLAALVPPLVTFLPGALLTTSAIDLATGQMVAGAARLAAGGMQLLLLALGITAGAGLVGVPAVLAASGPSEIGVFAPWLGVLVYGVGVGWHNGARPGSRRWILLVLVVAYAGQVVGGLLFGGVLSAFVGALAMTPVAAVAATRPTGPPAMVTFLPGFWLLVPGALGLVGVTSALGQGVDHAMTSVVTAGTTMVTISLGVLAGLALTGPWIGRLRRGARPQPGEGAR